MSCCPIFWNPKLPKFLQASGKLVTSQEKESDPKCSSGLVGMKQACSRTCSQPGSLSSFLSETRAVCCPAEYPAACPGQGLRGTRAPGIAAVRGNWRGRPQEIQAENGSYCGRTHGSVTECRSANSSLNLSVAYRAICSLKLFTSVEILLMKLHFIGALQYLNICCLPPYPHAQCPRMEVPAHL